MDIFLFYISSRYENRDKYSHGKSSNFSNQKPTTETTNVSVKKVTEPKKPQRARTASMPGENRKVISLLIYQLFLLYCSYSY